MTILGRIKSKWNAFTNRDEDRERFSYTRIGASYGARPDRARLRIPNERSIISSIYTRMSIDVSEVALRHVTVDDNENYVSDYKSGLQECLRIEANIDQGARAFRQDIAMTLFDEGTAAIVATDTSDNPFDTGAYDIQTLRVGTVRAWHPEHVLVHLYNQATGEREEILLPKRIVAIVENPLHAIMNEPNSTLQRLIRKLGMLDTVDEATSSGKLDLIIQLPYVVKSEARQKQAEQRRSDIEFQLKTGKYGIAYTDGTEKITQLNRPAENNLLKQIEYLTGLLYSQLGLTPAIMDGTATPEQQLAYSNRTIEPIMDAISEAMTRVFLTKTARAQGQRVLYFRNVFRLIPLEQLAEITDKFTRNEVLTANEIRGAIGFRPSKDAKADELRNSNMPQPAEAVAAPEADAGPDELDSALEELDAEMAGLLEDAGAGE